MASANQRLATILLGRDVREFINEQRAAGVSWRNLAADLEHRTNGQVKVSDVALAKWVR